MFVVFQDGAADGENRGDAVGSGLGAIVGVPEVGWLEGSDVIDGFDVGSDDIVGVVDGVEDGDDVGLVDIVGDELGVLVIGLSVGGGVVGEIIGDVDVALLCVVVVVF